MYHLLLIVKIGCWKPVFEIIINDFEDFNFVKIFTVRIQFSVGYGKKFDLVNRSDRIESNHQSNSITNIDCLWANYCWDNFPFNLRSSIIFFLEKYLMYYVPHNILFIINKAIITNHCSHCLKISNFTNI